MSLTKTIIIAGIALCASLSLNAQSHRLPASHARQHSQLLAHQRPFNQRQNAANINNPSREALQADMDIFGQYWTADRVNPYGNITIPATKKIDVSEYVAPVRGKVTSAYGWRPQFGRMHRGIDLQLNVGDTVRCAFSGKVRMTKFEGKGYGYYVVVRHDNGMETVYGHLSKFLVKPNQRVTAGQPIALGGNTGRSTGPHLHFETRYLGLAINPATIIDFEHGVTHRDIFAFSKADYDKSQRVAKGRPATAKKATAKKGRKASASTKKSSKKKSRKSRR